MISGTKNRLGRLVLILLTILATVGGLNLPAVWAASGDIYNLGTLLGDTESGGYDINDAGQVAGQSLTSVFSSRAFLYTGTPGAGGVMHDLGNIGGTVNSASAVNSAGQVAGRSTTEAYTTPHAFLYTGTPGAGGVMADLGTLGGFHSGGSGINDAGQVTGYAFTAAQVPHAFLYTGTPGAGGVMHDLGTLGVDSSGTDVNNAGQVTGSFATGGLDELGSPVQHAFLYTGTPGAGGVMHDLGTLGGISSEAAAINNAGQVAGRSRTGQLDQRDNPVTHAFLYTGIPGSGGTMIDLGTLGGSHSVSCDINDAGFVVGSANASTGGGFATLWLNDAAHTPVNLDAWLNATNPTMGAYWTLSNAYGINNNGLITGTGYYNDGAGGMPDGSFAFILDASSLVVPEPASFALAGLASLALLRTPAAGRGRGA